MEKIKKVGGLGFKLVMGIASCVFAYISLFVLGNGSLIIPYVDWGYMPTIKLGILFFSVLSALTLSYYYLITSLVKALLKEEFLGLYAIIGICILGGVLALYSGPTSLYIGLGDYLRDVHGINWYFMDWGGWSITEVIVMTPIISAIIYFLLSKKLANK